MDGVIRPIPVPERLGTPESAEFEAFAALAEALEVEVYGDAELSYGADELLVFYGDQRYTARRAFGAWEGDHLVGVASVFWELDPGATVAFSATLGVRRDRRREGIGRSLLAALEAALRAEGRTALALLADHRIEPGPPAVAASAGRLRAPQGEASIPADDPAARFAIAHGYVLGQLDRVSAMPVSGRAAEFRERLARQEASSPGYRLRTWLDRTPDDLIDALARARERMSVDAPSGGISFEPEQWDAERIRAAEAEQRAAGRTAVITAAVDAAGDVAGYTQLTLAPRKAVAYQDDTLVLAAHRGHGLGLRMKLANLLALIDADPSRVRVVTWNADENAHMLAINLALGFEPIAIESAWQRTLSGPRDAS
ncbi:GNAT family N-acetyltransferase [Agromyces sp. G08B096]|uniref:GNAT family N-acetyltransferase n=1 Tax=Agromyces sp. G08B096 TaxID=3156399 RepID=A0AAU7WBD5_9MICO